MNIPFHITRLFGQKEDALQILRNADLIWIRPEATEKLIEFGKKSYEEHVEKAPLLCGNYDSGAIFINDAVDARLPPGLEERYHVHRWYQAYLENYRKREDLKKGGPILPSHSHLGGGLNPSEDDRKISKRIPELLFTYSPKIGRYNTTVCPRYRSLICFLSYFPDADKPLDRQKSAEGWVETGDQAVKLGVHAFSGQRTIPTLAESKEVAILCGSRDVWKKIAEQKPCIREIFDLKEPLICFS